MRTEDLIARIAADAEPVRRLSPPGRRMIYWLLPSLVACAAVVAMMGPRPDLMAKLAEPVFLIEVLATFATALIAAFAALCSACPGRPAWEKYAPLLPLALWLATLGEGCTRLVLTSGLDKLEFTPDPICLPAIVMVGTVPALLLFAMVRRGAPTAPLATAALTALAASALGAATLRFFHMQDASLMVLVWQFGSVLLLTAISALFGRRLIRWPSRPRLQA